jgi:uncharacterized membrane protein
MLLIVPILEGRLMLLIRPVYYLSKKDCASFGGLMVSVALSVNFIFGKEVVMVFINHVVAMQKLIKVAGTIIAVCLAQ